jgi:hypothetical protein
MGRMKRYCLGVLLLAVLGPSCKSGGAKGPPAGPAPLPELLRPYEGALRLLPGRGDDKAIALKAGEPLAGTCDVAVRVRSLSWSEGSARFSLETVGQPRVGDKRVRCKVVLPGLQLALSGLPAGPTDETKARIDAVLLTPEAYLQRKGTAFDHAAAAAPSEVASKLADGSDSERRLARTVIAWPRQVLSIDATYHDTSGRPGWEKLVGFEALVGTDGRLYQPQVKTSIDRPHDALLQDTAKLWRFEPARRSEGALGARVALETVLRVY